MTNPTDELTPAQAARELGLRSHRTIVYHIKRGTLPAEQRHFPLVYSPVWVIKREDFEAWKAARAAAQRPPVAVAE